MEELEVFLTTLDSQINHEENEMIKTFLNTYSVNNERVKELHQQNQAYLKKFQLNESNAQQEFKNLIDKLLEATQVKKALEKQVKKLTKNIEKLKKEKEKSTEKSHQESTKTTELERSIHELQQDNIKYGSVLQQKDEIISAKDEIIKKLNEKYDIQQNKFEEMNEKCMKVNDLQNIIELKDKTITILSEDLRKTQNSLVNAQDLIKEKDNIIEELGDRNSENEEMLQSITEKEDYFREIERKYNDYKKENNEYKIVLQSKEETIKQMKEMEKMRVKSQESNMSQQNELLTKVSAMFEEKEKLQKGLNDTLSTIKQLEIQYKEKEKECEQMKDSAKKESQLIEQQKKIINEITIKNEMLQKHISVIGEKSGEEINTLMSEVKSLQSTLKENLQSPQVSKIIPRDNFEETFDQEQIEYINGLKEEVELLNSFLKKKEDKITSLRTELNEIKGEGGIKNNEVDKKIISILQSKLKISQKYLTQLSSENDKIKIEKENLKAVVLKQMDQLDLYALQMKEQESTLHQMKIMLEKQMRELNDYKKRDQTSRSVKKEIEMLRSKEAQILKQNENLKNIIRKQSKLIKNIVGNEVSREKNDVSQLFY